MNYLQERIQCNVCGLDFDKCTDRDKYQYLSPFTIQSNALLFEHRNEYVCNKCIDRIRKEFVKCVLDTINGKGWVKSDEYLLNFEGVNYYRFKLYDEEDVIEEEGAEVWQLSYLDTHFYFMRPYIKQREKETVTYGDFFEVVNETQVINYWRTI